MRLTSLSLTNYGVFRATRIAFDPAPGRINLLIAPNGYGKSILRQAFADLLFGIGGQTAMGFRYGYPKMRLIAEAVTERGAITFGRRKGHGTSLIDADGNPLDGAPIAGLLARADLKSLHRLLALDTEALRDGGRALLASGGELAGALLSAAGGLRGARELHAALEKARDAVAPERRAQSRPFHQALDAWTDARKRVAATTLKPEARRKQELELNGLRNEKERQAALHRRAMTRLAHLERVRRVRGTLAMLDQQAAWLAEHPDAPVLPEDAGERLDKTERRLREAELAEDLAAKTRARIAEQLAGVAVDEALTDAAAEIESLVGRAGAMHKAATDRPARQAEHAAATSHIAAILHQLGASAAETVPPLPAIARVRALLSEHDGLRADLARLPREIAIRQAEIAKADEELARLPAPVDMRAIERLAREIGADPGARAAEARRAVQQRRLALTEALCRAPGWTGDAQALADLHPLSSGEYESVASGLLAAERHRAKIADALSHARDAAAGVTERLAALADEGPIPDPEAVAAARRTRDAGWLLISRRLFGDGPDVEAEREWAGGVPLPLAYERALATADDLADRRGGEAARIERAAELRRQHGAAAKAIEEQAVPLEAAKAARERERAVWADLCAGLGLGADAGLPAVRDLLAARDRVIDALHDLSLAEDAEASLLARHNEWATRLAGMLTEPETSGLPALCRRGDEASERAKQTDHSRTKLVARRDNARQEADRLDREFAESTARNTSWQAVWSGALAATGRPLDEEPAVTRSLLDLMIELVSERQNADQLARRLRDMDTDMAAFRSDVTATARRFAPDLIGSEAFECVPALRRRLTEGQAAAQERDTLRAQLKECDREHARSRDTVTRERHTLQALLKTLGAATTEEARGRIALAAERVRAESTHHDAQRELREKGDGLDPPALRAEAAAIAPDDLPAEAEAAQRDRDEAMTALQNLAARIATGEAELERQDSEAGAAEAAAEQQAALARMTRALDEGALLHLAAAMLDTALAAVGDAGAPEVLGRISVLFRTLTAGAYDGVVAEPVDDGSARLIARERDHPDEPKEVAELSEGTRDQLFLALRIAAIEDHARGAALPPFIGDDILQTFDDDRAEAAMRALVELSRATQVIVLSHHRHLHAIATRLGNAVHVCVPGAADAMGPALAVAAE